jgi:C-terminal processing protease CtpA/Prc
MLAGMRAIRTIVALCSVLVACGAAPTPPPPAAIPPAAAEVRPPATDAAHFPDLAERRALFDALVSDVRKYHVFSVATAKALGHTWEEDVPELRRDFEEAVDEDHLSVALTRFVNSFHNPHCGYAGPDLAPAGKTTGFEVESEWRGGAAHFYVSAIKDPALKDKLAVGDEIASFDGIPSAEIPRRLHWMSHDNNWRGIAHHVAWALAGPYFTRLRKVGSRSTYVFEKRATHERVTLELPWAPWTAPAASEESLDNSGVDYATTSCTGLPDRAYGAGYELVARGQKLCIYASRAPGYRDYPIIRQFSYHYVDDAFKEFAKHGIRADHEVQKRELDRLHPKGVLLDLRDNGGGNNTHWFMDWYAPGPYVGDFFAVRLHPDFDTKEKLAPAHLPNEDFVLEQLAKRRPGQEFTDPRPCQCKGDVCDWDNRYTPSHRITKAPIALLVGPGCVSACDAIALYFSRERFGPLVGEPPASGTTNNRLDRFVVLPGGRKFGRLRLAFTYELDGKTKERMEGVPTPVDVPLDRTFDNRATYDRQLVDAAIGAFATYPKR